MDSIKTTYATFSFEWTVKSTSYQIQYRKAFNINEIDEIFCSIIKAKGNEISFLELAILLGFNLQDLAEKDILNNYLKGLTEYKLIEINQETIQLTKFGQEALQSKLKYKYYFSTTELFENQTGTGENFDFSFKSIFDIENRLSHEQKFEKSTLENSQLKQKLQFQLFGNDIYKGEIIEIYENEPRISYKSISLQSEISALDNSFQLSVFKSGVNKPDIQSLIDLPVNEEFKSKLLRKGMYHHILSEKDSISKQDIETYIDLWNWNELAENPKLDWSDKSIFELFLKNGDGSIWSSISEKASIESIKSVIKDYTEYWNWTTLTERFDDEFIKEQIKTFDWDFEELSYKEIELVTSLLSNLNLKEKGWDWNYLSKNLPDKFIEEHIEDFPWDFYVITESKNEVFKNTFIKYRDKLETLILKNWNWKFISEEINLNFLHKNISGLASKLDWHTVLNRFFINEELTVKCLNDESFKTLLKLYLPENFVVAHQKYLWTPDLIDFFENQNLIQWETQKYIKGFDTNENVVWSRPIFQRYHNRITTENGFLNVSKHISDYSLISDFPDFTWNWEGISQNKKLIINATFIEKAFLGELTYSNNLHWNEILSETSFDISFWNKNLETFFKATESEKQIHFWSLLTQKQNADFEFIFENKHFPWDWIFITENSSEETILDSYEDDELFEKWDWKIATRKIDKETVLELLEDFAQYLDWKYLINEVFTVENELAIDKQLPKIAACLTVVDSEKRKEFWKDITSKIQFETLFPIVQSTIQLDVFEWDWDFISNHKHFPTDIRTLNQFREKINWTIFTESYAIKQKFNPDSWDSGKQWFSNIDRYLQQFEDYWNWQVLSKNGSINYNRLLLQKYKTENWDWDYLTEFGGFLTKQKRDKENEKYLEQLVKQFPEIKFDILSKRKDIKIDSSLILSTKDKNWDWQVLSENEKAEISNELILELKNKNWNWQALSKRKNIEFSNETLLQLLDKDWDWNYLSENRSLEFTAEFIDKTKAKSWNWKLVSRHKSFSPSVEILTLTKDYDLDWQYISKHSSLSPTKEILAKFENKWHWQSITENPQINFDDIDFLERFADKWNWNFICETGKLALNNQILTKFKVHLEWNLISSNTNVHFTKEIIQEFKQFWNWSNLKANKRVEELLGSYVTDEINKNATLNFIDKIEQQWSEWKGSIYHFSHIDNAVEIIKNKKIQSRNKAIKNSDSAGKGVIDLRHDAHDFARFYFRPHTPTQFYNEFLGKNTTDGYSSKNYGWVSWYDKARGLGFPKCPIPIFFKFSLKEILFKNEKKCRISNGNMQTSSTKFGSIEEMINKFGFDDLYYTPQQYATKEDYNRYRNYAQQEFLVKDELAFDDLVDFEIVCPSEADRTLLKNLLGNEHKDVFSKIVVDRSYYNNENPRIRIEEEDSELHISTNFNGDGYFVLNGASDIKEMEILVGDVTKTSKDKIIFKSNISLGNVKQNIQLNFIDESNRNWFVYAKKLNKNESSACKEVVYWNSLQYTWKKQIFLNYLLSIKSLKLKKLAFLDDSYGLEFIICDILINETVEPEVDFDNFNNWLEKKISNLNENEIVELFDIKEIILQGINSLKPLELFPNLRLVYLDNCEIKDINSLNNLNYLSFYESPEYPTNNPSLYQNPEYFSKQINITSNAFDFIEKYFYDEFYVRWESTICSELYNPSVTLLLLKEKGLSNLFESKVRHYTLENHTILVCNVFEKYFTDKQSFGISIGLFRTLLLLHDIGKPEAFTKGNKDNQYKFTENIIKKVWSYLPYSFAELQIILALLEGDYLGYYFQNGIEKEKLSDKLHSLAKSCGLDTKVFFRIYMIYYQCDIASYTADAGGIKFLEHLFEYRNGEKVFDKEEGILKMSPKYWEIYKQLKNEIENGN
jgi:hypothetical protein